MSEGIEQRKREHVRLAARGDVASTGGTGLDDVHLVHEALPELDAGAIDTSVELLGRRLELPLVIASMTCGHAQAAELNAILARAAGRFGVAMGGGSQRAALLSDRLVESYAVARREAPDALLLANIGVAQLVPQRDHPPLTISEIRRVVEMIDADALCIHLNATQEIVQPEGDRDARGWLRAIAGVAAELEVPVVAKETGADIGPATARRLRDAGVGALDVGGLGGTSFAAVERARAVERDDERGARLGDLLRSWGIPTAVSIAAAAETGLPVIGTGGIRTGLDAARATALGATAVGVARPLLQAALDGGDEAVAAWIDGFALELRTIQFLTGSPDLDALRGANVVVTGRTAEWLQRLGIDQQARRRRERDGGSTGAGGGAGPASDRPPASDRR